MQNYKMTIAYDGRRYKGFKKTKENDEKSIQGKLEFILFKLYDVKIEVISAANTDAGVHAQKQVVNFKAPKTNSKIIYEYFEEYLPEDIVVNSIDEVDERFHSRYMIKSLTYQYRLWKENAPCRPLFERHLVKLMDRPLEVSLMQDAAKVLLGEHDFSAFSVKSKIGKSTKEIISLNIEETHSEVIITIEANGFLLGMERILVGTLIQAGLGQRKTDSLEHAFKSGNKDDVGHKAMAHALCLMDVLY